MYLTTQACNESFMGAHCSVREILVETQRDIEGSGGSEYHTARVRALAGEGALCVIVVHYLT